MISHLPTRHGHEEHGDEHGHEHEHGHGLRTRLRHLIVPHTHDAADTIDDELEASAEGIRTLKITLVLMLGTTVLQGVVVFWSGSVALLADTIHNLSDALTAVPLWIAFVLARRTPTRRYPYGFQRAEDLAGLFIVAMIALSAAVAAWEAIDRLIHPRPIDNLGWLIAAGAVGFVGNEIVAGYRIRVGRRIGSAALVADGVHARTDGFTSLAVVVGGLGVLAGFPLADPIVGIVISAMITVLLVGTIRSVGRRLLDGVEPRLIGTAEHALHHVGGIATIERVRLRWVGHRLSGDAIVTTRATTLAEADALAEAAEAAVREHLPRVDDLTIRVASSPHPPA